MREISVFTFETVFTAIWLLTRIYTWVKYRRPDWKQESLLLLLYINFAVIIRFVFFPKALADGHVQPLVFDPAEVFPFRMNLVPLVHLFEYDNVRDIIWNVVGNMALFIPTGILLPIIYRNLDNPWKVGITGALISLSIEILQLPFASRATDVDDLILNTMGVIVGYGIYTAVKRLTNNSMNSPILFRWWDELPPSGFEKNKVFEQERLFGSPGHDIIISATAAIQSK